MALLNGHSGSFGGRDSADDMPDGRKQAGSVAQGGRIKSKDIRGGVTPTGRSEDLRAPCERSGTSHK